MSHRTQDMTSQWMVVCLSGELDRDGEVLLSRCMLAVVERHPADEVRELTSGRERGSHPDRVIHASA
jgi:hypothetical protein